MKEDQSGRHAERACYTRLSPRGGPRASGGIISGGTEGLGFRGTMKRPQKSSRRDFLQGRAAAEALRDAVDAALPAESPASKAASGVNTLDESPDGDSLAPRPLPPRPSPKTYLVRIGRRAMACEFEVLLNAGQYAKGTEAAVAALDLVEQLESQLTVYRDDSEVSRLNRTACVGPVEVESRLVCACCNWLPRFMLVAAGRMTSPAGR